MKSDYPYLLLMDRYTHTYISRLKSGWKHFLILNSDYVIYFVLYIYMPAYNFMVDKAQVETVLSLYCRNKHYIAVIILEDESLRWKRTGYTTLGSR